MITLKYISKIMFVLYLEDGHYGGGEVVKICSGCFFVKIKSVMRKQIIVKSYKRRGYLTRRRCSRNVESYLSWPLTI